VLLNIFVETEFLLGFLMEGSEGTVDQFDVSLLKKKQFLKKNNNKKTNF